MYDQEALGKFEVPPIKKRNDFALWLKILKKTDYCYGMEEVLGTYRMGRAGSVSRDVYKRQVRGTARGIICILRFGRMGRDEMQ